MSTQKQRLIALAKAKRALRVKVERDKQSNPNGGLMEFIRYFWKVLEPERPFVEGWVLEGLCEHLEAITRGELTGDYTLNRLLANVSPGSMKSLCLNVFWPAFEWGPMGLPHLRYVAFSYAAHLTERDNAKFRDLIRSREYQELWGHVFKLTEDGKIKVANDKTGFKFASSVGGVGTGERADRVLCDDPHSANKAESETIRESTVRWFRETMSNRLNSIRESAIVVVMQRVHEEDVSGAILEDGGYEHYCIPMEYDSGRHCTTSIGWTDPRSVDGELAWPERFSREDLQTFKRNPYLWSGQYQQMPVPRGGGLFKFDWFQSYPVPSSKTYDFIPLYTVASLDTAFKEKQENDYSALTVWSVYEAPKTGQRRIMLMDAWQKRLQLHGTRVERNPDEDEKSYLRRAAKSWGLCEWVAFTCTKRRVNTLLIEDSARGTDVNNEIKRLFADRSWGTQLIPARGDKWSRAHSVVDLFTDEMIYAPGEWQDDTWVWRDFADMVINQACSFPRAAHDDLVDSMVQALRYLRDNSLAIRRDEKLAEDLRRATYKPQSVPLYDV